MSKPMAPIQLPATRTMMRAKNSMTAQVDYMKAELAHRISFVKLMSLLGNQ